MSPQFHRFSTSFFPGFRCLSFLVCLTVPVWFCIPVQAEVPDATIDGPIRAEAPGHPSNNFIYSASAIELQANGYIEEEYFISGMANRYALGGLETGAIIDSGHPYLTRLVVRRPLDPEHFNGVVVVEWLNVTGGPDKDIDWWQSGPHLMRNGYAYVMVSAQQMGIDTMQDLSPDRYADLDITHGGTVENDALSFDIFSAAGKAITRDGESPSANLDILDGLRADMLIATGHSQSASRLATYLNNVHPHEPIYDGFMVHGGGGRIRDDGAAKIFKVMAETDMRRRAAEPQPDSETFRQWEVAGASHVDEIFELEYAKVRNQHAGLPIDNVAPRDTACALPPYSRVPFRDVMDAAFEHLVVWIRDDLAPPRAEPLRVKQMMPEVQFARDEFGNVLGGIRLAAHAVPIAKNTGMNSGTVNRFCFLYGSHEPFADDLLDRLYPSHSVYVNRVRQVVGENVANGYILPYAAAETLRAAKASAIGR
ncbi:MAG: alpha/beta hydrolase domain-containing protein [Pseudohongiellaceae bacterium]